MEKLKKPYTAPAAELLLLAPAEALASQDDQIALNKWGNSILNGDTASIVGGNSTYWTESGQIIKRNS